MVLAIGPFPEGAERHPGRPQYDHGSQAFDSHLAHHTDTTGLTTF